jgi:acetylornithine aminotransferase/acetylornithine/N-succinyldiaminopimelate aminotransferase
MDALSDELLTSVRVLGAQLVEGLAGLPGVVETRGLGLLVGAELDRPAADVVSACLERGLLVTSAGGNVLRLTPPLMVGAGEVEQALAILGGALL